MGCSYAVGAALHEMLFGLCEEGRLKTSNLISVITSKGFHGKYLELMCLISPVNIIRGGCGHGSRCQKTLQRFLSVSSLTSPPLVCIQNPRSWLSGLQAFSISPQ